MKINLFLSLLVIFNVTLFAQSNSVCGTVDDPAVLERIYTYKQSALPRNNKTNALQFIPVQIHSVGRTGGTGHITTDIILKQICTLNEQFDSAGMYFYLIDDIKKINNSNYFEHDYSAGSQMMSFNKEVGKLNIFICAFTGDTNIGGYFLPSQDAIAVRIDQTGPGNNVWAHEVGHYFGLPHTFNGFSGGTNELVDGSNCAVARDGFCDTRADPNDFFWFCPYSGVTTDANGASYDPIKHYICLIQVWVV